jgi:hypothetical protein
VGDPHLRTETAANMVLGDSLQRWSVDANIFNRQSRDDLPVWGLGMGLTTPQHKNKLIMKGLRLGQIPWIKIPNLRYMDMRYGTWNVRSLYRAGSLVTVSKELSEYNLDLVGEQVRWAVAANQQGEKKKNIYIYIYIISVDSK